MKDPTCHATLAPRVYPLRMREDWHGPPPILCLRALCLLPPLDAARRGGGGDRGEDGMLLALIEDGMLLALIEDGMLLALIKDKRSGARLRRPTPLSLH